MSTDSLTQAIRTKAASFLLLAFVCVQFIEFAHQHQHASIDTAERCVTCVQLDSSSVGQVQPGETLEQPVASIEKAPAPRDLLSANTAYRLPARAPPKS